MDCCRRSGWAACGKDDMGKFLVTALLLIAVVWGSAYALVLVLEIRIGMERKKANMIKIVEKVMENWKEVALVVESIVILMVAFGCGV